MASAKNNNSQRCAAYVIGLIAAAVNSSEPPENDESLDWQEIVDFAKAQSVLNIIAYSVERLKNKPDAAAQKYLREVRMEGMVVEAQQEIEASDAMDKLEQMGVRHMPLKGYIIKNLYPSPDMRTMGDIDILVEADRCGEAVKAFEADGFCFCDEGVLHSNVKRGNAYIEFHRAMVDEYHEILSSYFGSGFERAKKVDGYNCRYELSHEDLYIFLIAHVAKHYRYGGTGIRSLLDLYIYRKAYPDMDADYVENELSKIGLEKFHRTVSDIADSWFADSFDGKFTSVSAYIVSGGVYGSDDAVLKNNFILDNGTEKLKIKKFRRIIGDWFPSAKTMSLRYGILKKLPWLTPLFWIIRAVDTLIHIPKNVLGRAKDSIDIAKIDSGLVDAQKDSGIDKL